MAKEAGILYAAVAMATDYDCWRDCEDNVHAADVVVVFKQNVDKITNVLLESVKIIGSGEWKQDLLKLKVIFILLDIIYYKVIKHIEIFLNNIYIYRI